MNIQSMLSKGIFLPKNLPTTRKTIWKVLTPALNVGILAKVDLAS
jgi:hypothetical protein